MKTRIITAVVGIAIFIPFLIFSDTYAFPAIMSFAAVMGVYEMLKCLKEKSLFVGIPSYIIAVALPICARYYGDEQAFFNFAHKIFVAYLFYLVVIAVFSKGKKNITDMAMIYLTISFIINGLSSIILLRDYENGEYIYLLVFLLPWISDSFAYFTGYFLGKHKLIPDVSPKKTVEGAIGGVIGCTLTLVLYGFVMSLIFVDLNANYIALVCVGIVLSVVSQCGDLMFSLIKRKYGIKDYGKLMPGHGGILDRFDSVIVSAPFVLMMFDMSGIFRLFK